MAQGLNLIFGWDLFTCVFLTATGAVFHLLLAVLLDIENAKILGLFVTGFVLLSFVLGVLLNQPGIPLFINGVLTNLSGESTFVLMSLLGATLVPHNLYLHSSIIQVLIRVILNFHLFIYSEMSVSMACCQENMKYLLRAVYIFATRVLLLREDEMSASCIHGQLPFCWRFIFLNNYSLQGGKDFDQYWPLISSFF